MQKKYNLALIPTTKGNEIINYARQFSPIAESYLLGYKSLPHVTLYQFEAEQNDINHLWQQVLRVWNENLITLTFAKFSYITFDNNTYWLSLIPDHSSSLRTMHAIIANAIGSPIKPSFDPHMSLFNTRHTIALNQLTSSFTPITDTFALALGKSDNNGQFIEIVYSYPIKKEKDCL